MKRARTRVRIFITLAATMSMVLPAAGVGHAEPVAAGDEATARAQVQEILRTQPTARQLADGSVQLEPDVRLIAPRSAATRHDGGTVNADCPYYHLCLYQHKDFGGWGIAFESCRGFDLYHYPFPPISGANWANRTSSLINNQTGGTVSWLVDNRFSGPNRLRQHAFGFRMNLALDPYPGGGNWDEVIDFIEVC